MHSKYNLIRLFNRYAIGLLILTLIVSLSFLNPRFIHISNILTILSQVSMIGVIAVAVTYIILMAEIDVSIGSTMALSAMLSLVLQNYFPCTLSILIALLCGSLIGALNGLMIIFLKASSILITLSIMIIVRGIVYWISGGYPVVADSECIKCLFFVGNAKLFGVPFALYLFISFVVLGEFILRFSMWGRSVVAIGKSQYYAIISNIAVYKVKLLAYMLTGFTAAFAGIIYASKLGSVTAKSGQGYEIDVIAAILLGGTQINGAKGSIFRTLLGVVALVLIVNVCDTLGFDYNLQYMIKGLIILLAIIYSRFVK